MDNHSIGKTIAELRKQKGWTQAELAEKLHVSDKAVSKWENDGGTPGIENFPALAQLFGVTTDYLISGKVPQKEVEVISRAELCAKNDDPLMLKEINPDYRDEKGKTLKDYIIQYDSEKAFVAFCETYKGGISQFDIDYAIKCCIVYNRLDLLEGMFRIRRDTGAVLISGDVLNLMVKEDAPNFRTPAEKNCCVLSEDTIKAIVCDERVNKSTLSVLFGTQRNKQYVWFRVFPYLIHQAYINEKEEMLNRLITITVANNKTKYANKMRPIMAHKHYLLSYNDGTDFGFVRILKDTITAALDKGDFDSVEKFNDINKALNSYFNFNAYVASEDEIRIARLHQDKTLSKEEIIIQSSIRNNVIDIEVLMGTNNMGLVKKALSAYPVHIVEYLQNLYNTRQMKTLFEWAVDKDNNILADAIVASDDNSIKHTILAYVNNGNNINGKYINLSNPRVINTQDAWGIVEQAIKDSRQKILAETDKKEEGISIKKEYPKEYFLNELKKGNTEIVVIKLCVRMEANLRILSYEGTFEEMLSKYCSTAACSADTARLLHRLRMYRNSLVHSEKSADIMTEKEINACIEYICNMI